MVVAMVAARVLEEGPTAAVVDRPDQWWAVPEGLRVHRIPAIVRASVANAGVV
jgi:hypothetical protein